MKHLYIFAAFMAAATATAQTVVWDGENLELGSQGGCWDDGAPTVVNNPETDGINPSAKCLKFTMTDGSKIVKVPFRDWIQPDMKGSRRVSLMIKKAQNENVNIELSDPTNGANGYWEKVAAWYGGEGTWQKVYFDLSTNVNLNDFPGVISITAQTGYVSGSQDVYIDNITLEPAAMVGDKKLTDIADGSLTGDVVVSGAMMRGDCQNTNGDWFRVDYDDFALLAKKLGAGVTSIDLRGVTLKDPYDAFSEQFPGIVINADYSFGDHVTAIQKLGADAAERPAEIYNLLGQRLNEEPQHGIFIRNGKKIVRK